MMASTIRRDWTGIIVRSRCLDINRHWWRQTPLTDNALLLRLLLLLRCDVIITWL